MEYLAWVGEHPILSLLHCFAAVIVSAHFRTAMTGHENRRIAAALEKLAGIAERSEKRGLEALKKG